MNGEKSCYEIDKNSFFPYRQLIRAGKLLKLPLKDRHGNICGFDPATVQDPTAITGHGPATSDCGCPTKQILPVIHKSHCATAAPYPILDDNETVPMTAVMKRALKPTEDDLCRNLSTPLQRLTAIKKTPLQEQMHARVRDMEEKSLKVKYPTPMTLFRNDDRILRKAYRTYKRDVQLQKERGIQSEQPKEFPDQATKEWYYDMISSEKPCINRQTLKLLNRSDCVQFKDAMGGSCFHCPDRKIESRK
ncbi:tyrosine-protein kinase receptor [Plakobranchus ocellatus]|uniref:Tyrosine-protein kinase receptor n=1 Tax=Plakobranchus ocellatus TaxID=259542 RepID=A0AAV3YJ05_9GAST|nr:tyrosine-protein kinase receptor [Plakobranchus ocellatus]